MVEPDRQHDGGDACTTFVASQVPPRPTSSTPASTGASAKVQNAIAVSTSKKVMGTGERPSTTCTSGSSSSYTSTKRSSVTGSPSMQMRSVTESRWGLV